MSIDASPPAQPPQLSPDGKWVWDGSQWQPVATVEPTHGAVFAAWNSIKVEPADPVAPAVQSPPAQVEPQYQAAVPAPDYSYTAEPITPLWEQPKSSGVSTYLYVVTALVVLVMAMVVLNSMNLINLPWFGSRSSSADKPQASPTPSTRSEFARADTFVNGYLGPAVAGLNQTLPAIKACTGILSNSCFDAITANDKQTTNVLAVIDHATIPSCIAAPMKKYRSDLALMEAGLQLGLKGYKDNQLGEVTNGVNQFVHNAGSLQGDANAVNQALKTQCSMDLEGP